MPKAKFDKLKAWSYSAYTMYVQCPLSICFDKIQRIRMPEEKSPVLERGNAVHKEGETYVGFQGKRPPKLSKDLSHLKERMDVWRKSMAKVEVEWAFDNAWNTTSWFAKDCWLRIKVDLLLHSKEPPTVDIKDYKTGKVKPDHAQQRSLYALGGLRLVQIGALAGGNKNVKLTAEHIYIDTKQEATQQFTLKQLPALQREWMARTETMMNDTQFKLNEGYHCRWCKFRKSAGGPCPANQ